MRAATTLLASGSANSGSAKRSETWTTRPSSAARPVIVARAGVNVRPRTNASISGASPGSRTGGIRPRRGSQVRDIRAAQPRRGLDYGVEHRLQIEGRTADQLQQVARRGLVFERLFEVARAGLQFAEQPRILHRDDRLVGKGAHQFDLPLGERLDPQPGERNHADRLAVAQERHPNHGAAPGRHGLGKRELRLSAEVLDMHDPAFERRPRGDYAIATGDHGSLAMDRPTLGSIAPHELATKR